MFSSVFDEDSTSVPLRSMDPRGASGLRYFDLLNCVTWSQLGFVVVVVAIWST